MGRRVGLMVVAGVLLTGTACGGGQSQAGTSTNPSGSTRVPEVQPPTVHHSERQYFPPTPEPPIEDSPSPTASLRVPTFLDSLAVPASVLGAGFVRKDLDDGRGLDTPTLDLCGYDFSATESRRTDRLQLDVTNGDGDGFSNEVVTYNKGGTDAALRQARDAVRTCSAAPTHSAAAGISSETETFTPFDVPGLQPGSFCVVDQDEAHYVSGLVETNLSVLILQRRRNVYDGVYAFAGDVATAKRIAIKAAQAASQILAANVA